ncbi:peptidase inhibitor family I36 protein [Sorangium sp. So ce542]|jgi:peptidase inhibitor family I36|uniref:peptidase inhibitor family I36 protein n=1 Tax=Sorangium sp. So ce542 TaxID=3133316 RepID=UPI003F642DD3
MRLLDLVQNLRRFTPSRSLGLRALVGVGVLAGAGLLVPEVASADPVPCPFDGVLCLFEEEGYGGEIFNVRALNPQVGTCVNLPEHGWEGRAHSAYNTNGAAAAIFTNEDCIGYPYPVFGESGLSPLPFVPKSVYVF